MIAVIENRYSWLLGMLFDFNDELSTIRRPLKRAPERGTRRRGRDRRRRGAMAVETSEMMLPGLSEGAQALIAPALSPRLWLSSPHMSGREQFLVTEAFASNFVAPLGPMVDRFEADLARVTGLAHVAALSSGTAAMHLALRLSGIAEGDEVWGATLTFIGGTAPVVYERALPVFFDCDPATALIDLDLLEAELERARKRNKLPKVVVTTDLYGNVVDPVRMERLRDQYGFIWIADSAEAVGSTRRSRPAGKGADFAVYSFNGNKIITTSGGGALASDRADVIERARFLATQARDPAPHYEHTTIGFNYRMSNICAAIGVGQLGVLFERVARRRAIFARYAAVFGNRDTVRLLDEPADGSANRWLTVMLLSDRCRTAPADVMSALARANIESRPVWKPMHLQPVFKDARAVGGEKAAALFARGICLPSGSNMSETDLDRVIAVLRSVLD